MPKVSVIIPVYGVEKYIERCAVSLFEQTLEDMEFIFVDDCTPDKSIEILKDVLDNYPNRKNQVIIHRMDQNSGLSLVRKWGIQNATGDYVIHCDSDDWVDTEMYNVMYKKAIEENSDMVICDYLMTDGVNKWLSNPSKFKDKYDLIYNCLSRVSSWSVWNKMVKRDVFQGDFTFPVGSFGEDGVIAIQSILKSNVISFVDSSLYFYFVNNMSMTHSRSIDKIVKHYYELQANTDIIFHILNLYGLDSRYSHEIMMIKYWNRCTLYPVISDKNVHNIWMNSYREINKSVLFDRSIPLRSKIKFIYLLWFAI